MSFHMPKAVADGINFKTADPVMDDSENTGNKDGNKQTAASAARFVGPLKPEEVRWFYKKTVLDKTWLPLNGRDSLAIESAYRSGQQFWNEPGNLGAATADAASNAAASNQKSVVVFGGLYRLEYERPSSPESPSKTDISTSTASTKSGYRLRPIYWEGECLLLTRGTWFLEAAGGDWQPLDADSAEFVQKVEDRHVNIFANQRIPEKPLYFEKGPRPVLLEVCDVEEEKSPGSGARARWHSVVDIVLFNNSRSTRLWRYLKLTDAGTKLVRGYHTEAKEEDGPPPVTHLVFLIHGIGQKRQRNKIVTNSTSVREIAEQLLRSSYPNLGCRPMFLPVDWRTELQLDEDLISTITPNYLEQIRGFFNETLLDLLYYASPFYGPKVIKGMSTVLNRLYRLYISNDPGFEERGGKVSLVAHSLGAVITYDILTSNWSGSKLFHQDDRISVMPQPDKTHPNLEFSVQNLFCVGSPLGVFLAARRRRGLSIIHPLDSEGNVQCNSDPGVFRLHNIYHPADPVAYRVEPLVSARYADVRPLRIHRYNDIDHQPYDTIPPEILVLAPNRSRSPSPTFRDKIPPPTRSADSEDTASGFESDEGPSTTKERSGRSSSPPPPPKRSWSAAVFSRLGMAKVEKEYAVNRPSSPEVATVTDGPGAVAVEMVKVAEAAKEALEPTSSEIQPQAMDSKTPVSSKAVKKEVPDIPPSEALPYRMDFTLRQGRMEYAYWAAIVSHISYWANHDVVMYMLSSLYGPPPKSSTK